MNTQTPLPTYIDPIQFAQQGLHLQGQIPLAEMSAIADKLANLKGTISANLNFGIDHEGFYYIKGSLETQVNLSCQRCMQTFVLPLNLKISLSPVKNEDGAKRLPSYYEPLAITEEPILLKTLLEEELLLSLPLVAKHDLKDCAVKIQKISLTGEEESSLPERKNPFDVLKKLQ
jgi:uncharacterized protein